MKSTPSPALSRYLSPKPGSGAHTSPTHYIVNGAACVTAGDLAGLPGLLPQVGRKAAAITGSVRLRRRLDLFTRFFTGSAATGDRS